MTNPDAEARQFVLAYVGAMMIAITEGDWAPMRGLEADFNQKTPAREMQEILRYIPRHMAEVITRLFATFAEIGVDPRRAWQEASIELSGGQTQA